MTRLDPLDGAGRSTAGPADQPHSHERTGADVLDIANLEVVYNDVILCCAGCR